MFREPEPVVRLTRPSDINNVTMMDLKCYDYPMPMKDWQERIQGSGEVGQARIVVVEVKYVPAGFAMWSIDENQVGLLHRLGVLPQFRRRHIGTVLMAAFLRHCAENHCDKVRAVIPSINCKPGDPDDVSAFLKFTGWKASGEVLSNYRVMYGDLVDGYVFERRTDVSITR